MTTIGFFHRARAFFAAHGIARIVRVITDNDSNYRAATFTRTVTASSRHQRTAPTPHDTTARSSATTPILAEELPYSRVWTCEAERATAIKVWNVHHNHHRAHTAIGDCPPASRLRTGVTNVQSQN